MMTNFFTFVSGLKRSDANVDREAPSSEVVHNPVVQPSGELDASSTHFLLPFTSNPSSPHDIWRHDFSNNWNRGLFHRMMFPHDLFSLNPPTANQADDKHENNRKGIGFTLNNPYLRYLIARNMSTNWFMSSSSSPASQNFLFS